MTREYTDLVVKLANKETVDLAAELDWRNICLCTSKLDKRFLEQIGKLESSNLQIHSGFITRDDIRKSARKALDLGFSLVVAEPASDNSCREATECWEVDVLLAPEKTADDGRDYMDQKNSGLDHVMAKFMAERDIALGLDYSYVLDTWGMKRSQIIGRVKQNIRLARKYGIPLIATSGATDASGLRAPLDLIAFYETIGLSRDEALNSVTKNPLKLIAGAKDRENPDKIMKGFEVVNWGSQKPSKEKKKYGWY